MKMKRDTAPFSDEMRARAIARSAAAGRAAPGHGHPAGGMRDYDGEESAFLVACEAHRAARGLRFLKATDYLAILKGLGYRRAIEP